MKLRGIAPAPPPKLPWEGDQARSTPMKLRDIAPAQMFVEARALPKPTVRAAFRPPSTSHERRRAAAQAVDLVGSPGIRPHPSRRGRILAANGRREILQRRADRIR